MVYASDTLGAAPVLVARLITSTGFASHHSPDQHLQTFISRNFLRDNRELSIHRYGVVSLAQPLHWCRLNLLRKNRDAAFAKRSKMQIKKKELEGLAMLLKASIVSFS
ncbi:hypothetical protein A4A49_30707 [Nicotiana attenuata]|uniref:Uncharacterized protein n=1 Tax=Nicotiana attenuata TaxID=49451 RepID=A0A1J6IW61_NICAT|nr:hypothetical protein A4A49_30707 [Nicotiana attenuata]